MGFKVRGHGNGHLDHVTYTYRFTSKHKYDWRKLKKYLILRNGHEIEAFMWQLKKTDIILKLIWSASADVLLNDWEPGMYEGN